MNYLKKGSDKVARIRTIDKAYQEIKRADPDTCISKSYIRQIVYSGDIRSQKTGNRYLFDLDELERYLKEGDTDGAKAND